MGEARGSSHEQERNHQSFSKRPGNLTGPGGEEIGAFPERDPDSGGDSAGMMKGIRIRKQQKFAMSDLGELTASPWFADPVWW